MKLIAFCIRYPVSVIVGVILALLLCVWRAWLARVPAQDEACVREPVPALLTERAPARN